MQAKGFGWFNGVNVVNVRLAGSETAWRIDPFFLCRKVFGNFSTILEKIRAQQAFLNKVTPGAYSIGIVYQLPFFE